MSKALLASALLSASALGLMAAPALAQTSEIDVSLPYERFTLNNGLDVIVHEDRKAPIVAVQVVYEVGSKDEPAGKTGFAHLFEHLMFNGSEHFDKDFFVALKDMGASQYNGTTNVDRTNYYETVPTGGLERILFLESDRMGHLLGAVTQEKLDNQIGVVQNEKRLGEDRPFGRRIWTDIFEQLYPVGHPYHHSTIGSMEDLENASLDDVRAWFEQYYGAANATLVLAGDVSAEEARPLVEKYFGDIRSGPPLLKPQVLSQPLEVNKYGKMQDRVAQPRIYRAYVAAPTGSADSPLLDVMAKALGGGKTSRLHRRLVDELQIANSADVFYGEDILSGQIFFIVDAKTEENIPEINRVIDEEIAEFLRRGPTRDEVERTVTTTLASAVRGLEDARGKASTLARGAYLMDDPDYYVDENLDILKAATPQSVKQAAARYLTKGYYELQVVPFPDYAASGEGVDREAGLPALGAAADISFPEIDTATLDNGMEVVVAPRPTVPVVEIAVQFDAGTATSNVALEGGDAMPGLASMAVNLMDEGTSRMSAQEIARRQEELGAQFAVYNNQDDSRAYLSALKANLRPSVELLADIVMNADFPEEEIEKFRKQTIDELKQEKADVRALADRALRNAVFGPGHGYGQLASPEEAIEAIEAISRDDLMAWKNAWIRPGNARIFVTGDVETDEIVAELNRAFSGFDAEGEGPEKDLGEPAGEGTPRLVVIDKPDTMQAVIYAGRLLDPTKGDDRDTALEAMNDIFGGNFLSRINMNLREEKGWSYGVFSGARDAVGPRLFFLYAPVQIDRTGDSVRELVSEMKNIVGEEPPTQAELDQTIAGVVGALPGRFETARSVLFSMADSAAYGLPLDYDANAAERYNKLKTDDLEAAANSVIDPDTLTWVIVGDWSVIEPQLEGLDLGPIEIRRAGGGAAD